MWLLPSLRSSRPWGHQILLRVHRLKAGQPPAAASAPVAAAALVLVDSTQASRPMTAWWVASTCWSRAIKSVATGSFATAPPPWALPHAVRMPVGGGTAWTPPSPPSTSMTSSPPWNSRPIVMITLSAPLLRDHAGATTTTVYDQGSGWSCGLKLCPWSIVLSV